MIWKILILTYITFAASYANAGKVAILTNFDCSPSSIKQRISKLKDKFDIDKLVIAGNINCSRPKQTRGFFSAIKDMGFKGENLIISPSPSDISTSGELDRNKLRVIAKNASESELVIDRETINSITYCPDRTFTAFDKKFMLTHGRELSGCKVQPQTNESYDVKIVSSTGSILKQKNGDTTVINLDSPSELKKRETIVIYDTDSDEVQFEAYRDKYELLELNSPKKPTGPSMPAVLFTPNSSPVIATETPIGPLSAGGSYTSVSGDTPLPPEAGDIPIATTVSSPTPPNPLFPSPYTGPPSGPYSPYSSTASNKSVMIPSEDDFGDISKDKNKPIEDPNLTPTTSLSIEDALEKIKDTISNCSFGSIDCKSKALKDISTLISATIKSISEVVKNDNTYIEISDVSCNLQKKLQKCFPISKENLSVIKTTRRLKQLARCISIGEDQVNTGRIESNKKYNAASDSYKKQLNKINSLLSSEVNKDQDSAKILELIEGLKNDYLSNLDNEENILIGDIKLRKSEKFYILENFLSDESFHQLKDDNDGVNTYEMNIYMEEIYNRINKNNDFKLQATMTKSIEDSNARQIGRVKRRELIADKFKGISNLMNKYKEAFQDDNEIQDAAEEAISIIIEKTDETNKVREERASIRAQKESNIKDQKKGYQGNISTSNMYK